MPYSSEKQRRFMYSQHPEIAQRWADEGKNYVKDKESRKKSLERRMARKQHEK
jgi:hypothetical protein